jgi:UDP-N-acetylmuramoylalanine--D-glutamate ligase
MKTNWKNKKVAVLGLGVEGIASVRYLCEKGAAVTVLDEREHGEIDEEIRDELRLLNVTLKTGGTSLDNLGQYEAIIRSPGVRYLRKEVQDAKASGVHITSQTQLFFDECPCPVIGVTGTKGKGTTASLIYEMLKNSCVCDVMWTPDAFAS